MDLWGLFSNYSCISTDKNFGIKSKKNAFQLVLFSKHQKIYKHSLFTLTLSAFLLILRGISYVYGYVFSTPDFYDYLE